MIEIRTILCPIDFSHGSRRALDYAVAIARWYGSSVTVLHSFSTAPVAAYAPGLPSHESIALTARDRERLAEEAKQFVATEAPAGIPVEIVIREGHAVDEILAWADPAKTDLAVIGTHGRSGFERLVLGSVAEKVLRKAVCPVLSVPPHMPDTVPATPALFTRILCAVDFSDSSMNGLTYAASLAQKAGARLTLLHVMTYGDEETPEMYDTIIADERLNMEAFRQRCEETRRERLQEVIPEAVRAGGTVDIALERGKPYREILRFADGRQQDLIVMGVRGRGAADLMFVGSTAQHVIRRATCPVLTLRTP